MKIDTVLHLAAQTIVGIANRNPVSTFETNIEGTWASSKPAAAARVKQIVVASSDKATAITKICLTAKTRRSRAAIPTTSSKSCADLIAQSMPRPRPAGGDHALRQFLWRRRPELEPHRAGHHSLGARGERPVIRSDGQFVRDYFYVEDGAAAYMLLAEALATKPELRGQAFNFSNEDSGYSAPTGRSLLSLMDSQLVPEVRNEANNEIRHQYLSAEKSRRLLNWQPSYSLNVGLQRTIGWYKDFFGNAA